MSVTLTLEVQDGMESPLNLAEIGDDVVLSMSVQKLERVVNVTSFVQISSFGIILDFPSHCKKKLHDFTADSLVKAS
jgi:hypothetical protein